MDKQAMVREFHEKHGFARDALKKWKFMDVSQRKAWHQNGNIRLALIQEELAELAYAWSEMNTVEVADAIADLLYVVYGTAVATGIEIDEVFAEVHASNMTKEVKDGQLKPKGDGYKAPDIASILGKQGLC